MQRHVAATTTVVMTVLCLVASLHAAEDRAMHPALHDVRRILFYGDSLTDGSSYPDYVVNTLNHVYRDADFVLLNSAVAGDTARDLLKRLEADVIARDPDLVTICIGTNDCNGKRPVADYEADLRAVVDGILAHGAKVVMILPSPFGNEQTEARFADYLAVMRKVAAEHDLPIADAHGVFIEGEAAGRQMLGDDGVHHGADGFEGMARAVLDALDLVDVPIVTDIHPWPGLLLDWQTSAPLPAAQVKNNFDPTAATAWHAYDRQAAIDAQPWWDAPFAARGAWMPFAVNKPDEPSIAFGRTVYDADQAGKAELQIGGSRPLVVWLNGEEVWRGGRPHGYHPDADRVIVDLRAGENTIIVVCNFMAFIGIAPVQTPEGDDAGP